MKLKIKTSKKNLVIKIYKDIGHEKEKKHVSHNRNDENNSELININNGTKNKASKIYINNFY